MSLYDVIYPKYDTEISLNIPNICSIQSSYYTMYITNDKLGI